MEVREGEVAQAAQAARLARPDLPVVLDTAAALLAAMRDVTDKPEPALLEARAAQLEPLVMQGKPALPAPSHGVKPLIRAVAGDTNPEVSAAGAAAGALTGGSFGITVTG